MALFVWWILCAPQHDHKNASIIIVVCSPLNGFVNMFPLKAHGPTHTHTHPDTHINNASYQSEFHVIWYAPFGKRLASCEQQPIAHVKYDCWACTQWMIANPNWTLKRKLITIKHLLRFIFLIQFVLFLIFFVFLLLRALAPRIQMANPLDKHNTNCLMINKNWIVCVMPSLLFAVRIKFDECTYTHTAHYIANAFGWYNLSIDVIAQQQFTALREYWKRFAANPDGSSW